MVFSGRLTHTSSGTRGGLPLTDRSGSVLYAPSNKLCLAACIYCVAASCTVASVEKMPKTKMARKETAILSPARQQTNTSVIDHKPFGMWRGQGRCGECRYSRPQSEKRPPGSPLNYRIVDHRIAWIRQSPSLFAKTLRKIDIQKEAQRPILSRWASLITLQFTKTCRLLYPNSFRQ